MKIFRTRLDAPFLFLNNLLIKSEFIKNLNPPNLSYKSILSNKNCSPIKDGKGKVLYDNFKNGCFATLLSWLRTNRGGEGRRRVSREKVGARRHDTALIHGREKNASCVWLTRGLLIENVLDTWLGCNGYALRIACVPALTVADKSSFIIGGGGPPSAADFLSSIESTFPMSRFAPYIR